MERHFDSALRDLKEQLVTMAGYVEKAIEDATLGLQNKDIGALNRIMSSEHKINASHIAIDDACVKLLALHQPLARDLRLIIAILKINTDLERMGDQSVNIGDNSKRYLAGSPIKELVDIPRMAQEARLMVRGAIDAFVKGDVTQAREVLDRDDSVDALKSKVFKDVLEVMKSNPATIEQGLCLILIARNLERVGDHATNICEDVIFAMTGEDVRHGSKVEVLKGALE